MTSAPGDPWEQRWRFSQLYVRHLQALGRPFLPAGQPPVTAADYLEMLALGEAITAAPLDSETGDPGGVYRDAGLIGAALRAGATWAEVAGAAGAASVQARRSQAGGR